MVRGLLIYCIALFLSACSEYGGDKRTFVSDVSTKQISGELYLSEDASLNVFYDIYACDSFVCCLDYFNDTILKVFPNIDSPSLIGYSMRGQGPNDLLFPFFVRNASQTLNNKVKLVDLNAWSIKKINLFNGNLNRIDFDIISSLPLIPPIKDYNETDSAIYGNDVDMQHGIFFIYNKNSKEIFDVAYFYDKEVLNKYSSEVIPYLFENHLVVNEKAGTACVGMLNINSIFFYDLVGELKKELVIGKKIIYPEPDLKYLDFPNAKKYFVSMSGTNNFLYCLYNAFDLSRIIKFDWDGNLLSIMQVDMKLEKISVDPTDKYVYGIKMSEEGGSDIFKFDLTK